MSTAVEYEFPESVPGFSKWTWFACNKDGMWNAHFSEPERNEDEWLNRFPESGYIHQVRGGHTAWKLLEDLSHRFDWKASKFQTSKDG